MDLLNGTAVAGNFLAANGKTPLDVVADPANGEAYVANNNGVLSIVNMTLDRVVKSVQLDYSTPGLTVDPATGDVYVCDWVAGNLSVIDPATDSVVASIPAGYTPGAVAFDPANSRLYVVDEFNGSVTVINATSRATVAVIATGSVPAAIALDPASGLAVVANPYANTATVLNLVTNSVLRTLPVGTEPDSVTFDAHSGNLYVANFVSRNLSVISGFTGYLNGSITVPHVPLVVLADPLHGLVYAGLGNTLFGTGYVSAINDSTQAVVSTTVVGTVVSGLDLARLSTQLVAANLLSDNLTLLDRASQTPDGDVLLSANPTALAWGSAQRLLYVTDQEQGPLGPGHETQVNATVPALVGAAPTGIVPDAVAFDNRTGLVYVANGGSGFLTALNGTTDASAGTVPIGKPQSAVAYDARDDRLYVADGRQCANPYTCHGNVTILNATSQAILGNRSVGGEPTALAYDPVHDRVYVTTFIGHNLTVLNGSTGNPLAKVDVGYSQIAVTVDPLRELVYVLTNPGGYPQVGRLVVVNGATDAVEGSLLLYGDPRAVAVNESDGVVYVALHSANKLLAVGGPGLAEVGTIPVGRGPMALLDDPSTGAFVVADNESGTLSEAQPSPTPTTYPVTFTVSGLPAGAPWSVTVGNATMYSVTTSMTFEFLNGTYPYVTGLLPTLRNESLSPGVGSVSVAGAPVSYPLTVVPFVTLVLKEKGIPNGENWSVVPDPATAARDNVTQENGTVVNGRSAISFFVPVGPFAFYNILPGDLGLYRVTGPGTPAFGLINVTQTDTYFLHFRPLVVLTFGELVRGKWTGLPAGGTWSVSVTSRVPGSYLGPIVVSSNRTELNITLVAGAHYRFVVTAPAGYLAAPARGGLVGPGHPLTKHIRFRPSS